ncbi:MAG: FAD:protein FMN transferase [Erysipelotrichaceae bacterium]
MKYIKLLMISLLLLTGCSSKSDTLNKYDATTTTSGFDTFIKLIAYTKDKDEFDNYFEQLKKGFIYYNQLFDKYNDYKGITNVKTINDNAGIKPVKVNKELINMIELSKEYYELTNHQFDITLGPVLNLWHDAREQGIKANEEGKETTVPSIEALQLAKQIDGYDLIEINKKESTVFLNKEGASIDVGAIAKGYAAEQVAIKLEKNGLKHAIINAGGNVRIIGSKPSSDAWSVGIEIPNKKSMTSDSLASIHSSKSSSFVTSGDYQRYYLHEGKMMHHIIDPSTLQPARHARSVTVICENSGIGDALSTSLFTMSYEDGIKLIDTLKKQGIQVDAVWLYDKNVPAPSGVKTHKVLDYDIVITDGLKDIITFN